MPHSRGARGLALCIALFAGALAWVITHLAGGIPDHSPDFFQVWGGARALREGLNPYEAVAPGGPYEWGRWRLYYPLPALLLAFPLSFLPFVWAYRIFAVGSAAVLGYAVARTGPHRLPLFLSAAFFMSVTAGQWAPLLAAATLLPALAGVVACKPNVGAALLASAPSRRFCIVGATSGAVLWLAAFVVWPGWLGAWLNAISESPHFWAPVQFPGGVLLLLAVLRWRRPEARLLLALACLPQTLLPYETLLLFLIPATIGESALLALLSVAAFAIQVRLDPAGSGPTVESHLTFMRHAGATLVALVYLPALAMVLRRPNVGTAPAWWAIPRRVLRGSRAANPVTATD